MGWMNRALSTVTEGQESHASNQSLKVSKRRLIRLRSYLRAFLTLAVWYQMQENPKKFNQM
jgi:hypothetical protein